MSVNRAELQKLEDKNKESLCSVAALLKEDKTEERGRTKIARADSSALFLRGAIRQGE